MKNIVITIGREYGSGGKLIGEKVSKKLNINFYDKELLTKTYEKHGCNYSKLESFDETKRSMILKLLNSFNVNYNDLYDDKLYQALVSETIKDLANKESCVIIGRNSNNILRNEKNVINIFIYSNDIDFKVKRKMEIENESYEVILNRLKKVDKRRKKYYEALNKNCIWGSRRGYDYIIDSSILGIDGTVDLIVDIYKKYELEK